ncbi:TetR/AcrR family transcriptional regulator [Nakamurella sp. PAMC28650]|jgi:AcrR family transcriptional regulator|uniref:TetR/AcrR family transcriptional regulator n=1 Tax=Nakamurella sp. PAMC28650 TaxID=2762325 RepID=UPI00164EA6B7|nr:TetR/AcrR family transcriptional regulator [Nakamurella sp. PAMC28650]QNK82384.1 TetR/AcrR family transcriptional regulator [Nakamurella sp. PAMC28650]
MNAGVTARELARANLTQAIRDAARGQLAVQGAGHLSVRAVAREIGMVSSAVYRYFPTRDDLLTALIVDAYNALGAAVERADAGVEPDDVRGRWRAMCHAVRAWAVGHPHEYGLIFGSPVPDYRAPQDTVGPAARVPIALFAAVHHGVSIGAVLVADSSRGPAVPAALSAQMAVVIAEVAPGVPETVALRAAIAWTQLFGMVTFELFGQLVGTMDPADDFFATSVDLMAELVGIRPHPTR